jgi:regulator of sigma E protease
VIITILAAIFVLGILILVHELGHFAVAKWVGIGVPRFSIGLGPKIFGVKVGETEYCLAWIPFGGYVKMAGDKTAEPVEGTDEGEVFPPEKEFDRKPVWARLLVVSAGPLVNLLWAILMFTLVFYSTGLQIWPSTKVGGVEWPDGKTPEELKELVPGSLLKSIDGKEAATWHEYIEFLLEGEGDLRISWVDPGGLPHDASFPASDSLREVIASSFTPFIEPVVGEVRRGEPAEKVGLREGDRFLTIEKNNVRHEITQWEDAVRVIHSSPDTELVLTMQRKDSVFTVRVTPEREKIPDAEDTLTEVGLIGISQAYVTQPLPLLASFSEAVQRSFYLAEYILKFLGKLVTGQVSLRLVGGPILVAQMAGESARQGFDTLLSFMAFFSVNLAVLNILPVPVLDGGHVAFLIIEFLRRRPLSIEQRARFSQVGFILLVLLMVFVTFNDILRSLGF